MKKISKTEMIEILKDLLTYGCLESCEEGCKEHKYGKIFSVEFIKRTDGTIRPMTCRLGVKKGQTGRGLLFDAFAKGLLPVFDAGLASTMTKEEVEKDPPYRFVNLETLRKLTLAGEHYIDKELV